MPLMQFVNGLLQTLSVNAQTATDTVFTPSTTTDFPFQPQFTLLNIRTGELLLVTAMGAQWTIVRGYGGSSTSAINAGDALQYSITREMLIGGMMVKLDEQTLAADGISVMTVTVPSWAAGLCRNLQVRFTGTTTTNAFFMFRLNNDATANAYWDSYGYSGSGSSSNNFTNLTYWRCWAGYSNPLPFIGTDVRMDIQNADATDRVKTMLMHQWLSQNNDQSIYTMSLTGRWAPAAPVAITSIQVSVDASGNGTWNSGTIRAGARFILYGVP